jgi:hypothetical protein
MKHALDLFAERLGDLEPERQHGIVFAARLSHSDTKSLDFVNTPE